MDNRIASIASIASDQRIALEGMIAKGKMELSPDDLDKVSGGYSVTENADSMDFSFTEDEYALMKKYLETDTAKEIIAQLGYGDIKFDRNMTLPLEQGKTVKWLLDTFFK